MATTNNVVGGGGAKDERRRRIAERGSDRMALITGRIHALPPTPPSTTSSPTHRSNARHVQSLSSTAVFDHHSDLAYSNLSSRNLRPQSFSAAFSADYHHDHDYTGRAEDKEDTSVLSSRLKHQSGFKYSTLDTFEIKYEEEPVIQESDNILEVNHKMSEDDDAKTKPSSVTSIAQDATLDTKQPKKPYKHNKSTFFSSRELNSCIIASETTRALSSLIIAVLVVFFYMISQSIVALRPLYLVLLTDITIVIARLYHEKARPSEETEGNEDHGDGHSWGDAVKLLERGLVAYQAIRGVFIDCSIYVVVVVCGVSLM